jgi:hypothetical protein
MWKNIVETDRPQATIWRMRIACWITEATDTHSDYVLLMITIVIRTLPVCVSFNPGISMPRDIVGHKDRL